MIIVVCKCGDSDLNFDVSGKYIICEECGERYYIGDLDFDVIDDKE